MMVLQRMVAVALGLSLLLNLALATRKGGPRRERVVAQAHGPGAGAASMPAGMRAIEGPVSKATIAELRRLGVDEEIVTCLALAAGQLAFRGRMAEIYFPEGQPFWRQGRANSAEVRPIEMERDQWVEALLGHGTRATVDIAAMERAARFEGVPTQKIAVVEKLETDYRKVRELKDGAGWTEQERLIVREFEADLAKVLEPAELRAYQLRNSPSAIHLALELGVAPVTEEEFGRLWEIKQGGNLGAVGVGRAELFGRYREALPPETFRAVLTHAVPGFSALTEDAAGEEAEAWQDAWELLQTDADAVARGILRPVTREALVARFGEGAVARYEKAVSAARRR